MKSLKIVGLVVVLALATYVGLRADITTHFSYSKYSIVNSQASVSDTLFTPAVDGDYQIAVYYENHDTTAICFSGVPSVADVSISWTDDDRNMTKGISTAPCGQGTNQPIIFPIHAKAGNAVRITTTYWTGGITNVPYSVFITVIGE